MSMEYDRPEPAVIVEPDQPPVQWLRRGARAGGISLSGLLLAGCLHASTESTTPSPTARPQTADTALPDCRKWAGQDQIAIQDLDSQLKATAQSYIDAGHAPGMAVAYGCGAQKLGQFGLGQTGRAQNENYAIASQPVDPEATEYDLASVSKLLTTLGVFRLEQAGKLQLDDPIKKYLPDYLPNDPNAAGVTFRLLLEHKAGYRDGNYNMVASGDDTADQVWRDLENVPLAYLPGTGYSYSNFGFSLLYRAAGAVAGQPLAEFIQDDLLKPLGMDHTGYYPDISSKTATCAPTSPDTDFSQTYACIPQDDLAKYLDNISGHAGWFSTAADQGTEIALLANGGVHDGTRYISEANMKLLQTSQCSGSQQPAEPGCKTHDYSTGAMTNYDRHYFGNRVSNTGFGHTGWNGTEVFTDPTTGLWTAIMTNSTYRAPAPEDTSYRIYGVLNNQLFDATKALS